MGGSELSPAEFKQVVEASAMDGSIDSCGIEPTIRRPPGFDYSDQRVCPPIPAEQFH
jgi:hypothetical protein